ncbi:MAG: DUF402 domain-containing protein [Acetatifactor sp.]|nr:DUF402 domain-containing protein [Acetatifactor sp.]
MKTKRLNRDLKWGFHHYPYYQMDMDNEFFQGFVSVIMLTDGQPLFWEFEKAGKVPVGGSGMIWLQLIPKGKKRLITAMMKPKEGEKDYSVSVWYVDVMEKYDFDSDGVAIYWDKYIDVMATPQGDVKIDDRDELDEAYEKNELTKEQYEDALRECDSIVTEMFQDVEKTENHCIEILRVAMKMIEEQEYNLKLNA